MVDLLDIWGNILKIKIFESAFSFFLFFFERERDQLDLPGGVGRGNILGKFQIIGTQKKYWEYISLRRYWHFLNCVSLDSNRLIICIVVVIVELLTLLLSILRYFQIVWKLIIDGIVYNWNLFSIYLINFTNNFIIEDSF